VRSLSAFLCVSLLVLVALPPACLAAAEDVEGSKDYPLFTRMPNYYIQDYKEHEFGAHDGFIDSQGNYKTVEGRMFYISYYIEEGAQAASELQILRNHKNALTQIGGVVQYEDDYELHMTIEKDGAVTWVRVATWNGGQGYTLYIVEEEAMEQVVVADASSLARQIGLAGKVSVYGIYFDTGKAVVKPESEPALVEIARLLENDPELRLYVVGHTDNVGGFDYNMDLSRARAAAVVEVLTSQHAVDPARLSAHGVGPLAPATSNGSEDGRAKNRRVELVEQ
jgi:OOP family OmpA-OmpF porin